MTEPTADAAWLDEQVECSVRELAAHSRLLEAEIVELMECGAVPPHHGHALHATRVAARLRADFELDLHGVALAMTLLNRIRELETELSRLRARLP